ncbi:unnamed protein product, partial [Allacma fusca]
MSTVSETSIPEAGSKGKDNEAYVHDPSDPETGKKEEEVDPEARDREQWGNPIEFLLTCIAMSVGLGNIWRFPFMAYRYGGGAFLIPYLIVLTLIGRPMYFLELSLGQFSSLGQNKVWKISPIFKGVGIAQLYFENEWSRMLEVEVWYQAVQQCFFSLTTGFGVLTMFGSYNPFRHNVHRDAMIISGMDTFTSLLAGVTIFSVLGNLAGELDVDISVVALGGPGLPFISFAQGLSTFPAPQFFSVMFYLMFLTLGLGTGVAMGGTLVTVILDQWPKVPRWMATTGVCFGMFLTGLVYVTPGGFFILDLVDRFGANFVIYVLAIIEVSAVAYVYGINSFLKDLSFMLGFPIGIYWKFTWGFCIPFGMTGILVYVFYTNERWTYNGLPYPDIGIAAGWILSGLSLSVFPICAAHAIYTRKAKGFIAKFKEAYRATPEWGP